MTSKKPLPNDDQDFDPQEIDAAADENPTSATPPEVDAETENLTKWDEPPGASGGPVKTVLPDDEATVAEQLVDEGVDEAERDRRLAAADPDFEP
jgi:hypothetical protein